MKKSTKILVPALAVLALGMAASVTGTVAWYSANANAQVTKTAVSNGNVTVGASTHSVSNNFTITPSAITASKVLAYTDTSGNTFVSMNNGTGYDTIGATTEADKVAAYELKATVSYSGDLNTQASIQSLWEATVNNVVLTLTCSAVDNTSSGCVPISGTAATSDVRFTSGLSNYDSEGANSKSLAATSFEFGAASGQAAPYSAAVAEVSLGTVYVALTGRDNLVVDATHMPIYTLQVSASGTTLK